MFRNNLFIGGPGDSYNGYDSGPGDVIMLPSADDSCSFDWDGYASIGRGEFAGRIGDVRFSSLDELRARTTEGNAIEVDLSVFETGVELPADPFAAPSTPALLLARDGAAIDQGTALSNVNDDFSGSAPDLGAYELGNPVPRYGPGGAVTPVAGTAGAGGEPSVPAGGRVSSGGRAAGGAAGVGGEPAGGGAPARGGSSGATGARNGASGGSTLGGSTNVPAKPTSEDGDDGGCGCRYANRRSGGFAFGALGLLTVFALRRRASSQGVHAWSP
jgi:hypothetical protein